MGVAIHGTNGVTFNDGTVQASAAVGKNLIINGDMRIAQRGTSAVTASGSYPVDRFYVNNSSDAAFSAEQSTDVPSGQGFTSSLKVTYTTGDSSIGATQYSNIQHNIEGNNVAHLGFGSSGAKSVTLSFWVKASATGQYSYAIYNSAENRINPQSFTISSANTWEYKTITYDGDTTGTWLTNNEKGLTATLYTALGSNYLSSAGWNASSKYGVTGQANAMATTNNTFFITGVQLQEGTSETPFEHLQYGQQLALCQRYYYQAVNGNNQEINVGWYYSGTLMSSVIDLPVPMRVKPTLTDTTGTNYYTIYRAGAADGLDSLTLENTNANNTCVSVFNSSDVSATAGQAGILRATNASSKIELSAEL